MNQSIMILTDRALSNCNAGYLGIGSFNFSPFGMLLNSTMNQVNVIGNNNAVATGDNSTAISVNIDSSMGGMQGALWGLISIIAIAGALRQFN